MGACQQFEVHITGKGGHAGMPHNVIDPIVAAAGTISALQVNAGSLVRFPVLTTHHHLKQPLTWVAFCVCFADAGVAGNKPNGNRCGQRDKHGGEFGEVQCCP